MSQIFINYRNEDEPFGAALIDHELSRRFRSVFRASKSIPLGEDFSDALLAAVRDSAVLLAVIGPRWMAAVDEQGRRRIEAEKDWVRREIAEAFSVGVPVVPLLLNASLPPGDDLPGDIARLSRCQYLHIHHRSSRHDISRLADELVGIIPGLEREIMFESMTTWHPARGVSAGGPALDAYLRDELPAAQQRGGNRANLVEVVLSIVDKCELVVSVVPCLFPERAPKPPPAPSPSWPPATSGSSGDEEPTAP